MRWEFSETIKFPSFNIKPASLGSFPLNIGLWLFVFYSSSQPCCDIIEHGYSNWDQAVCFCLSQCKQLCHESQTENSERRRRFGCDGRNGVWTLPGASQRSSGRSVYRSVHQSAHRSVLQSDQTEEKLNCVCTHLWFPFQVQTLTPPCNYTLKLFLWKPVSANVMKNGFVSQHNDLLYQNNDLISHNNEKLPQNNGKFWK